jgi:simple sugar transport system permease protein
VTATLETPPAAAPAPGDAPEQPRRRRSDGWLVTLLAIVLALVIGGILMAVSDQETRSAFGYFFQHPTDALSDAWYTVRDAYKALFEGAVYDPNNDGTASGIFGPIAGTIYTAAPLICAALGIGLAFRSGLFNIGGQGQVIAGAMASGYVGFAWHLPIVIHLIVAIAAGVLGGAIWGYLVGWLKARFGAHEVITTIMLNYVALSALAFLIQTKGIQSPSNPQTSKLIDGSARLPHLFGASVPLDFGIVLAAIAAVGVWWLFTRSTLGFALRSVGANPAAARSAGMSVSRATTTAMALSGALTGLGGVLLALGGATSYAITPQIDNNVGFDAITVALLGRNSPKGIFGAGLLLGALRAGAPTMQAQTGVPPDIVTVIQALIVIFVAAPRLTRAIFRLKGRDRSALTGVTTNLVVSVSTNFKGRYPRHVVAGVSQVVLGFLGLWLFGLGSRSSQHAIYHFSIPGSRFDLGGWSVQARPVVIVLCAFVVVAGLLRFLDRLAGKWAASIAIFGLLVSFMTWSIAGDPTGLNIISLLQGALFPSAIPLILGAMAGVIGERAGVVNVALEGQLLFGAFAAAFVGSIAGSAWVGILAGAIAGVLVAALLSVLAIRYLVDQVIVGVVLNLLVLGVTNFLFTEVVTQNSDRYNSSSHYLHIWKVPFLGDIPVIGPVFFDGTVYLYFTYVAVIAVSFGLFQTRWGLRLRSVGEHPRAADTVGIKVLWTRYQAMLIAGVIAGLAGAFLVVGEGQGGTFAEAMSSGKGYIALAAVIFGRWTPRGAVLAALLFGFADQLQNLLGQASPPINPNLLSMAPYIATLFAVAGFVGRVRAPAADGQPYVVG